MFGLELSIEGLLQYFSSYAYEPWTVYGFIFLFMTACSFGFPVPEEVVLISSGLLVYMAKNPEKFPPPYPGAEAVDVNTTMLVAFFAVIISDTLVYSIGLLLGDRLLKYKWFRNMKASKSWGHIDKWFAKYGSWCCGIFRFTPGLRFPGHLSCGLMKIPFWTFLAIDGTAALVSVPTQVWLLAYYGGEILDKLQQFKIILFSMLGIAFIAWWVRGKFFKKSKQDTP